MHEIVARDEKIVREVWDRDAAVEFFEGTARTTKPRSSLRSPPAEQITLYRQGNFIDLCRGPHLPSTGRLGAGFKLMKLAGAYWRGDSRQRDAAAHLRHGVARREGAQGVSRSARGSRAPRSSQARPSRWTSSTSRTRPSARCSGTRRAGRCSARSSSICARKQIAAGYREVNTPELMARSLWEASGHWATLRREHVHEHDGRRADVRGQADELPRPRADLQERSAQLPRSAVSRLRSSARCIATSRPARCTASCACARSRKTTRTSSARKSRSPRKPARSASCCSTSIATSASTT